MLHANHLHWLSVADWELPWSVWLIPIIFILTLVIGALAALFAPKEPASAVEEPLYDERDEPRLFDTRF